MVGTESPHPYNLFGCTPCHGGRDRSTSFWSAGHSPENPREEARWTRALGWKFDRFNDTPVLPMKYTEAGCYRCHSGETNFRDAPTLDAGIKTVEELGCWGCHRIEALDRQGLPKVGPSLEKVASKVTREWATRWVMKPDAFRPSTKMPQFFYLENFVNVSGPQAPTAAQKHMNADGPGRKRRHGQRDRGLPLREVASRGGPCRGGPRGYRARPDASRGARLLRLPPGRSRTRGGTWPGRIGSSAPTCRASARRRAATGSTAGSWTRRRGVPTRRCRTCV